MVVGRTESGSFDAQVVFFVAVGHVCLGARVRLGGRSSFGRASGQSFRRVKNDLFFHANLALFIGS